MFCFVLHSKWGRSRKTQICWTIKWNPRGAGDGGATAQDTLRGRSWMITKKLIWQPWVSWERVNPAQRSRARATTHGAGEALTFSFSIDLRFHSTLVKGRPLSVRYGKVLDFSQPKLKDDAPLNLNKSTGYEEPLRTASAKQHYLKQSRYLPGNSFFHFIGNALIFRAGKKTQFQ